MGGPFPYRDRGNISIFPAAFAERSVILRMLDNLANIMRESPAWQPPRMSKRSAEPRK